MATGKFDYLVDHALRNVWCTPDQDTQYIIKPARLTPLNGVLNYFRVMWRDIPTPNRKDKWHIYQIGQLHPLIIGLFPKQYKWISLAESCNIQKMICDVYDLDGVQIPRFETYYTYNSDRDLLIAIKENKNIPFNFNDPNIFIRFYSNAYYNSFRADAVEDFINVEGMKITSNQDLIRFQDKYLIEKAKIGQVYCFVNGLIVNELSIRTMQIGDTVEFVYDSSIYKVVDFKVSNLDVFQSTLDDKLKYLLHYTGTNTQTIDYQDDIDVFILDPYAPNKYQGVYYHKNNENALRMVTHRDYSVITQYVASYGEKLRKIKKADSIDIRNLHVRLHIRKSGYHRPLIFDNNRIFELYKMKDIDIRRAMVGIDSSMPYWTAANLESSAYTEIMRSHCTLVTNELVQKGYGYNSISKLLADTPTKTVIESNRPTVKLPYGLQNLVTVYEYDDNGKYLGNYQHITGDTYRATNTNCALVEVIVGKGSELTGDTYGIQDITVDLLQNHRVYMNTIINGVIGDTWTDVTNSNRYAFVGNKLHWVDNTVQQYLMIRTDKRFLAIDYKLPINNGELRFSITHRVVRDTNNQAVRQVMQVPMGELDVFLNAYSLIKDLDYVLNFPEIVIRNKKYLVDPISKKQNIHIRFTGFCDKDLNIIDSQDTGFIEHNVLSHNNKYNIRDDKVLRIVVGGRVKTRDDLVFSEFTEGISVVNSNNGQPYAIRDIIVPLKSHTVDNTYTLREKSIVIDKAVSDYLTLKIPQPIRNAPSSITERYEVYSPFINKIIYDLANGILWDPILTKHYSTTDIKRICNRYEYLLKYDPTQNNSIVDSRFVIIHPTNLYTTIRLEIYRYAFLRKVVDLYCNGLVELSPFIQMQ